MTFEVFSQSTCYNLHRNICPHNLVTCQNDTCQIKLKPALLRRPKLIDECAVPQNASVHPRHVDKQIISTV